MLDKEQIIYLNDSEKKQLQHEINTYVQKYSKDTVGKGSDFIKSYTFEDIFFIRGEGFLTEAEKYLSQTPSGCETVRASRMEGIRRFVDIYNKLLKDKFQANVVRNFYDVKPKTDSWAHIVVFDRKIE